jgi:class 3 adenylate cyclase/DNA-binding beta-propeller fold protein YncE
MSELPSGTVTFLFTDIEGSTRLLHALGRERYRDVLIAHHRLVHEAIERNAGVVVDTQGDAFFAAFPRAIFAVRAAVEAQRALFGHDWTEAAPVLVRAGLHTGEAEVEDGRYVGLAVHRAQRIASAAHGGQTLLSATTRDLVEDDLPPNVRLVDLGEYRLKDLERPERLVQLNADGLPAEFPPPRREATLAPLEEPVAHRRRVAMVLARPWTFAAVAAIAIGAGVPIVWSLTSSKGGQVTAKPNSVAVIDARTNEVIGDVAVGRSPGPVAVGPEGVWVGNLEDATISHIDPSTRRLVGTVGVGANPTFLTTGFGAVWAENSDDQILRRVDPGPGQVTDTIRLTRHPASGQAGLAVGEGAIWTGQIDSDRLGYLVRIDPHTSTVEPTRVLVSRPSDVPETEHDLAIGEGAVWLTSAVSQQIRRIDPGRRSIEGVQDLPSETSAVAAGAGAVWVALHNGTVYKLDPETLDIQDVIRVSAAPVIAIAVRGGAVWTANGGDGTVSRINAHSGQARTIRVGGNPSGIGVGAGVVWVSVE